MSLLPPIIPHSDILEKLPKELAIIVSYVISLRNTITQLLESNEEEFEGRFTQTKMELLKYLVQADLAIKDHKDVIEQLSEIYSATSTQLEDKLSEEGWLGNPVVVAIANANEIILDFFKLALDPNINISVLEYAPAFESYLDLSVCFTALVQATENKNSDRERNLRKLTQRCQESTWKLESYVETIEIETDPEQRVILERVKGQ